MELIPSQNKTLISINAELKDILKAIEQQEGEITPEQETMLAEILQESKDKVTNYCVVLDRFDEEKDFITKEIRRLKEYAAKIDSVQDKLKSIAMKVAAENGKLDGNAGRWISTRKSKELVIDTDDIEQIPFEYLRIKYEFDKHKIKKAIEEGEQVPFCQIKENINLSWK